MSIAQGVWRGAKEVGWLPFVLAGIGGFSVLSIAEDLVFARPLELVAPLQWVFEGYERVVTLVAAVVEPPARFALAEVNARLGLDLHLAPHWRSLFVLLAILGISIWRVSDKRFSSILKLVGFAFILLICSLVGGLLPREGIRASAIENALSPMSSFLVATIGTDWPRVLSLFTLMAVESVIVSVPIMILGLTVMVAAIVSGPPAGTSLPSVFLGLLTLPVGGFFVTWCIYDIFKVEFGGAFLGLMFLLGLVGVMCAVAGAVSKEDRLLRLGLTSVGGYLAAGLILFVDNTVKLVVHL